MAADFFDPTASLLADTQARLNVVSKPPETSAALAGQSAQSTPPPAPVPPANMLTQFGKPPTNTAFPSMRC